MTTYPRPTRRWTRAEYDRLIEVGVFRPGEPVELLGGELIVAEPQGSLYARARVEDYWILDLGERALEVYRESVPDPSARFGWRYASRRRLQGDGVIAPLAAPAAPVRVADLLP